MCMRKGLAFRAQHSHYALTRSIDKGAQIHTYTHTHKHIHIHTHAPHLRKVEIQLHFEFVYGAHYFGAKSAFFHGITSAPERVKYKKCTYT